jgi:hypothetical protein
LFFLLGNFTTILCQSRLCLNKGFVKKSLSHKQRRSVHFRLDFLWSQQFYLRFKNTIPLEPLNSTPVRIENASFACQDQKELIDFVLRIAENTLSRFNFFYFETTRDFPLLLVTEL